MFNDESIGRWAVRRHPKRFTTTAHLIDSIVAGDIFTACGRRMDERNQNGTLEEVVLGASGDAACMHCQRIRDRREDNE